MLDQLRPTTYRSYNTILKDLSFVSCSKYSCLNLLTNCFKKSPTYLVPSKIRVVHNPAILIPLVEKNGNPATFAVIHAIF